MRIEMWIAAIILVIVGLVYFGSEQRLNELGQAEFDYRYQN